MDPWERYQHVQGSHLKQFWLGMACAAIPPLPSAMNDPPWVELNTVHTSLSPHVSACLLERKLEGTPSLIQANGLIDWKGWVSCSLEHRVKDALPQGGDVGDVGEGDVEYIASLALVGHSVAREAVEIIDKLDWKVDMGQSVYKILRDITQESGKGETFISVLRVTFLLERLLGDILSECQRSVPRILRDVLLAPQLVQCLGQPAVDVLRAVVGPPYGLNLRNIAWHGFVTDMDRPWIALLVCLVHSVLHLWDRPWIPGKDPRSYIVQWPAPMNTLLPAWNPPRSSTCCEENPDVKNCSRGGVLCDAFRRSYFFLPQQRVLLCKSIHHHYQQEYGKALMYLLPVMEHAMRRAWVAWQDQSESRITAEAVVLYTTMDMFLELDTLPFLPWMGQAVTHLLRDMLLLPQGPRIRDRLAHGEMDLDTIPEWISDHMLAAAMAAASLIDPLAGFDLHYIPQYTSTALAATRIDQGIPLFQQLGTAPTNDRWLLQRWTALPWSVEWRVGNVVVEDGCEAMLQCNVRSSWWISPSRSSRTMMRSIERVVERWFSVLEHTMQMKQDSGWATIIHAAASVSCGLLQSWLCNEVWKDDVDHKKELKTLKRMEACFAGAFHHAVDMEWGLLCRKLEKLVEVLEKV